MADTYITDKIWDLTGSNLLRNAFDRDLLSIVNHDNLSFYLENRGANDRVIEKAIEETKRIFPDLIYVGDIGKEGKENDNNTNYIPYGTYPMLDNLTESDYPQTRKEVAEQGYGLDVLSNDKDLDVLFAVVENCKEDGGILTNIYENADFNIDLHLAIALRASGNLLERMCNEGPTEVRIAAYTRKLEMIDSDSKLNSLEKASEYGDAVGAIYTLKTEYLEKINEHIKHIEEKQNEVYGTNEYNDLIEEKAELYRIKQGLLISLSSDFKFSTIHEYVGIERESLSPQERRIGIKDNFTVTFNIGHITDADTLSLAVTVKTYEGDNTIIVEPKDFYYHSLTHDVPFSILTGEGIEDDAGEIIPELFVNECLSEAKEKALQQYYIKGSPIYNQSDRNFTAALFMYSDFYETDKRSFLKAHGKISEMCYDETELVTYRIPSKTLLCDDIINCCQSSILESEKVNFTNDSNDNFGRLEYGLLRVLIRRDDEETVEEMINMGDISEGDWSYVADVYLGRTSPSLEDELITSITLIEKDGEFNTPENRSSIKAMYHDKYVMNAIQTEYNKEREVHKYATDHERKSKAIER